MMQPLLNTFLSIKNYLLTLIVLGMLQETNILFLGLNTTDFF